MIKLGHKKTTLILLPIILGFIGYIAFLNLSASTATTDSSTLEMDLGIPVETVQAAKENLIEKVSYVGTIEAKESVEVTPKIVSEIKKLYVKEGDIVEKGQIIAELNNNSMDAKLNTTQAKIETVKYNHKYLSDRTEKYKLMYESDAISKDAYEKVLHEKGMLEMQLKELYAVKNELKVNIQDTTLKSPINGTVRKVNYNTGDLAMAGRPIAILDDTSELAVKTNVTELDLGKIKKGTRVLLNIPSIQGKIEALVTEVMPSVNPKTRIGEVKIGSIKLDDKLDLALGSSAEVEFIINEFNDALVIPANAIKQLADKSIVYTVVDNTAREVEIKAGAVIDGRTQVEGGLNSDSTIIVKNINKLYDGAKIYIYERKESK